MNSQWQIFSIILTEMGGIPSVITTEGAVVFAMGSGAVPNGRVSGGVEVLVLVVPRRGSTGRPSLEYMLGPPAQKR